jgi:hypothetical protein
MLGLKRKSGSYSFCNLDPDIRNQTMNARAVVAGTFGLAGSQIWRNVRAEDGQIIWSVDLEVSLNQNTQPLLSALRCFFVPRQALRRQGAGALSCARHRGPAIRS